MIEKKFISMMGETIEQVNAPRFQKIEDSLDIIQQDVAVLKDDVSVLKEDVGILKEKVGDLENTTNRIEMRQSAEIVRNDQHGQRIEHLEKICLK